MAVLGVGADAPRTPPSRRQAIEDEISGLQKEMEAIDRRATGILVELSRLEMRLRLRRAELERLELRIADLEREVREGRERVRALTELQERRSRSLLDSLRALYLEGPSGPLKRLFGGVSAERAADGLRWAAFAASREAATLRSWREDAARLSTESERLAAEGARLKQERETAARERSALETERDRRFRVLEMLRGDRGAHETALRELEEASRQIGRLVGGTLDRNASPQLDVRKFRGLLDWPNPGEVESAFGTRIHPRFRTTVPHPGLDIAAREGEPVRAVFEGRVAFASWLHGYGLTVILDHGHDVASVYAHASVLLVEKGETVERGRVVARSGESGSLRGPYLYFEIRERGKPVDPAAWLRRR